MEIYKQITNYENLYEISNYGNVRSLRSGNLLIQEVVKRTHTNYRRVSLSKDGIVDRYQVHRLVAKAFIPNIDSKSLVNHKDNNGENNHYNNLEWCTHSENMIHAQKQGRLTNSQSLAGKANGKRIANLIDNEISGMIGTTVYNWTIKSLSRYKQSQSKYYLNCNCNLCGSEQEVALNLLRNGTSRQCKSCTISINSDNDLHREAFNFAGKSIANWTATDVNQLVKSKRGNSIRKTMFILCKCNNCINQMAIKMDRLKDNNPNICTICQQLLKG